MSEPSVLGDLVLKHESSLRLELPSFPLIVGVVFIHAYGATVGYSGGALGVAQPDLVTEFVRDFISQGLARVAVTRGASVLVSWIELLRALSH